MCRHNILCLIASGTSKREEPRLLDHRARSVMTYQSSTARPPEEDDDDILFNPDLFVCNSYKVTSYDIGDIQQDLLCSQAATTDHDLTGQVVWPVSIFLSWFVERNRALFEGVDVLELGAGCGLSGLVASRFARRTLLTDGHEVVVDLLQQNAARQRENHGVNVAASVLEWGGSPQEIDTAITITQDGRPTLVRPQVLLGADVVCWPDAVVPFVQTVFDLLTRAPDPATAALYLGFVVRATNTERQFRACVAEKGMRVRAVPWNDFLPEPRPQNTLSNMELHLLIIDLGLGEAVRVGTS